MYRLLELQRQELKKRVMLRARRFARKQYKEFLDQLLQNASGDVRFDILERHLVLAYANEPQGVNGGK